MSKSYSLEEVRAATQKMKSPYQTETNGQTLEHIIQIAYQSLKDFISPNGKRNIIRMGWHIKGRLDRELPYLGAKTGEIRQKHFWVVYCSPNPYSVSFWYAPGTYTSFKFEDNFIMELYRIYNGEGERKNGFEIIQQIPNTFSMEEIIAGAQKIEGLNKTRMTGDKFNETVKIVHDSIKHFSSCNEGLRYQLCERISKKMEKQFGGFWTCNIDEHHGCSITTFFGNNYMSVAVGTFTFEIYRTDSGSDKISLLFCC